MTAIDPTLAASVRLASDVRMICYALIGVRHKGRDDAGAETACFLHKLRDRIGPLDRAQLGAVVTTAAKVLGVIEAAKLIGEQWREANLTEDEIFEGLAP